MELKKLFTKQAGLKWGIPLLLLIIAAFYPLYRSLSDPLVGPLYYYLPYLTLAVAWTMFSGTTGYISLASAAFYGIGIYAAALFGEMMPFPLVILIGAAASFAFAFIIGAITLRLRGIFFSMFTFGLVLLMYQVLIWYELTIKSIRGYFVVIQSDNAIYFYLLGLFVITMIVSYLFKKSKFGLALTSIGENENAAEHIGVNVTMVKILTFSLSAVFMGATGAIMATKLSYIDPGIAFDPMISFSPALMATFGGMGNIYGPVMGSVIFYFIQWKLQTGPLQSYYKLIFGAVLVITIMYLPYGLMGLIQKLQKRMSGVKRAPITG
jgi:branched-chain amino acid transport system permease protein